MSKQRSHPLCFSSWDHDHAEREAIYDAMVEEYEIDARIDAVNQQLDYAQARMRGRGKGGTRYQVGRGEAEGFACRRE
jgi:hypothetical protein